MRRRAVLHEQVQSSSQMRTGEASHRSMGQPRPPQPIRVFIADRHEIMRIGLRAILEEEDNLKVVGDVDNIAELLSGIRRTRPNIILLDSWLPERLSGDGYSGLFNALQSVSVIMLMGEDQTALRRYAVESGVHGYLSRMTCHRELSHAIRTVAKGEVYLGPEGSSQLFLLLGQRQNPAFVPSELAALSPQEYRVIALIAEGNTNKEIAVKLSLSEKTVKNYIANMFAKLAIERRTQAAALYTRALQQCKLIGEGIPA